MTAPVAPYPVSRSTGTVPCAGFVGRFPGQGGAGTGR
jgi:hypothetical protein